VSELELQRTEAEARVMTKEQLAEVHKDALDGMRFAPDEETFEHYHAAAKVYVRAYARAVAPASLGAGHA
jgi:hypothetical protein